MTDWSLIATHVPHRVRELNTVTDNKGLVQYLLPSMGSIHGILLSFHLAPCLQVGPRWIEPGLPGQAFTGVSGSFESFRQRETDNELDTTNMG